MYAQGRYFTVTGQGYFQWGDYPIAHRTTVLQALAVTFQPDDSEAPWRTTPGVLPSNTKGCQSLASTASLPEIHRALTFIPRRLEYDQWLSVLMAVHSHLPNDLGVAAIEAWSPGAPGEVQAKFNSFKRTGITIKTLYAIAANYGYRPLAKRPPAGDLRSLI